MSYIYSQEQGEEYWRAINSDIQSSEQSSGNHTVRSHCKQDNKTEHSHPSLSGETLEHSTGDHGVDAWILSARASPVSRSQSRETSSLVRIQEMGGPPPFESFGKFDQSGCCLRTYQVSLLTSTCTPYSGSWPRAGMIVDGTAYLRTPVAPLTKGTGSGSLPTPTANTYGTNKSASAGSSIRPSLNSMAKHATWPTPDANCGARGTQPNWKPTRASGCSAQYTINQAVRDRGTWPTPCASDHRDRGNLSNPSVQRRQRIGKQVGLGQCVSHTSGQLNPDWVELLMGWPKGWTSLEPLPSEVMEDWLAMDNYWPHDWEGDTPRTGKKANNSSRLKAIGNGQVPACVVKAWRLLR